MKNVVSIFKVHSKKPKSHNRSLQNLSKLLKVNGWPMSGRYSVKFVLNLTPNLVSQDLCNVNIFFATTAGVVI